MAKTFIYSTIDTGVRVLLTHRRKLPSQVDAFFCLATFTMVKVCNFLLSVFLRTSHQDFHLRNLRIIEPNEVTPSGDTGVETGNNFAYKLDETSQEDFRSPHPDSKLSEKKE
jgi:hypothetical protein